jgi:WD40 repeat protein
MLPLINRLLFVHLWMLASVLPTTAAPPRTAAGDPLPSGALARLGTTRFRLPGFFNQSGALSPDGKTFALPRANNSLSLLDTTTGKEVRQLRINAGGATSMSFAPDGKSLAVANVQGLTLYDARSGDQLAAFPVRSRGGPGGSISFSADGRRLAMGNSGLGQKTPVLVWDVRDKKEIAKLDVIHDQQVHVALSADGKTLATWGQEMFRGGAGRAQPRSNIVQLWDVETGKETRQLTSESYLINALAFSPDGKQLAMVEGGGSVVSIREAATGKQQRRIAAHSNSGTLLRYSPDGKQLMAATSDGFVQLWDAGSGKRLAHCRGPKCRLLSVAFLSDGKLLAAGIEDQTIRIWEVPGGRVRGGHDGHTAAIGALAFSRDGKTLISVGSDGVRLWETATGKAVRHDPHHEDTDPRRGIRPRFGPSTYLLSPDGRLLIEGAQHGGGVRVLERASGEEICTLDATNQVVPNGLPAAFAEDGITFACLGAIINNRNREMVLRVWDLSTSQEIRTVKVDLAQTQMSSVALSPDGKVVALASSFQAGGPNPQSYEVRLSSVGSGKDVCKFSSAGWISALTFSPDGARVATAGQGQQVHVWDAVKGTELRVLEGPALPMVSKLVFAPDGRTLAAALTEPAGQTGKVRLWEMLTGKVRAEFSGHQAAVNALAFSPDGRMLASGGADSSVLLWDTTGRSDDEVRAASPPDEKQQMQLWSDLNHEDGKRAFRAMARLSTAPAEAVALLQKHLAPDTSKLPDDQEIERMIADLDSEVFATREKATRALQQAGKAMLSYLTKALETKPGLEQRRRLEQLVKTLSVAGPSPELIRPLRTVELLERLGTPKARKLLESLAGGHPDSPLTVEAKTARQRLARRP